MRTTISRHVSTGIALALCLFSAAVLAGPVLYLSRTTIEWYYIDAGLINDTQPVFVTNTGDSPLTLTGTVASGRNASNFQVGGTCQVGVPIPPNARCRIDVDVFLPDHTYNPVLGKLTVSSDGMPAVVEIGLFASDSDVPLPLTVRVYQATPDWLDFPPQAVGTPASAKSFVLQKDGFGYPGTIKVITLVGADAPDFSLLATDCIDRDLVQGQTCIVMIGFAPTVIGPRSAQLQVEWGRTANSFRSVTGIGAVTGTPTTVDVVEYFNDSLDHYFITWVAAEQANLDAGKTPTRWARTGSSFRAYTEAQAGSSPVCRYYIPPDKGDSHFFGRGTVECNATGAANPTFVLEAPEFMQLFLPTAGVCPAGTTTIYRAFSNRADANHRYMTDRAIRDQMVGRGWLAEGDGPDLVVMCGAS